MEENTLTFPVSLSALTLEHLEATFYTQALEKFPSAAALGLINPLQLEDLKQIASTEAEHVTFIQTALQQAGIAPVEPCTYDFSTALADPATLLATAGILENVGVSAYLGAAGLIVDTNILASAASILTIEARHQSAIRVFSGTSVGGNIVPQAFDVSLGLRAVFSLAAPFITSCPEGSNLVLEPFPTLALAGGQQNISSLAAAGQAVTFAPDATGDGTATHCAFTSGTITPGGTAFTSFTPGGGCQIPPGAAGVSYVSLVNSAPADGVLTDTIIVAGPVAVSIT